MIKKVYLLLIVLLVSTICSAQLSRVDTLYFETDQSSISIIEEEKILDLQSFLDTVQVNRITISAYCDDRGSTIYNAALSEKRAINIAGLINANTENIELVGKGELEIDTLDADLQRQRKVNRRAEIVVEYMERSIEPIGISVVLDTLESPMDSNSADTELLKELSVGDVIVLENILFVGGTHMFLKESYPALNNLAVTLKKYPNYHILILGHVCCTPGGGDGLDYETGKKNLSETRAKAVYDYLINSAISKDRLKYKGLKGKYPTGKEDKYDRRVEIEITKIGDN